MCLMADNEQFAEGSLIEFLIFKASENGAKRQTTYQKAVDSFVSYLRGRDSSLLSDPAVFVCDWTVNICVTGISLQTALPYLNSISGLYKKAVSEGLAPETDIFSRLRTQLKNNGDKLWKSWLTKKSFEHLRNLTRGGLKQSEASKVVVYSLINGCMPAAEAANAKLEAASEKDIELLGIDTRQFVKNRKYLFSFDRSGVTPTKQAQTVNDAVMRLFIEKNISVGATADDTLRSYWAYAALRMGIAPHAVLSFFKTVPSGLPILSVCTKEELPEESRKQMTGSVAEMFTCNPPKWYVMRLRPGVKFDELENRLTDLAEILPKPELFYPCDEIYHRINKKLTVVKKPVIPDIVFFKSRETDVYPMFQQIGEIAWGYKTDGKDGNNYAAIPRSAFERFQEAIGKFTPEYEVAPIGEIPLKQGDTVVIIGAEYANQRTEIKKIEKPDAQGRVIYRMSLLDVGFEWTVAEDSRLVRKA